MTTGEEVLSAADLSSSGSCCRDLQGIAVAGKSQTGDTAGEVVVCQDPIGVRYTGFIQSRGGIVI